MLLYARALRHIDLQGFLSQLVIITVGAYLANPSHNTPALVDTLTPLHSLLNTIKALLAHINHSQTYPLIKANSKAINNTARATGTIKTFLKDVTAINSAMIANVNQSWKIHHLLTYNSFTALISLHSCHSNSFVRIVFQTKEKKVFSFPLIYIKDYRNFIFNEVKGQYHC